ncbi:hypothetical protein [Candidatus Similichlamydia laticola]|uniref:Uncharacterized protein n=1 Tax=Candidatus Similichlamydia laticola TaxID=2170265 RepID=A0A369KDK8_9BACT|nr:hypothetical protein [Candidatus Similichlamydia laticola]RDB31692.1 hypothetical protein HAT2_00201 [Candidatus Similichlamydia laticola]
MSRVASFIFRDASLSFCFFVPSLSAAMIVPKSVAIASCFFSGLGSALAFFEAGLILRGGKLAREIFLKSRSLSHVLVWVSAVLCLLLSLELAAIGTWFLSIWVLVSSLHYGLEYYFCCGVPQDIRALVRFVSSAVRSAYVGLSLLAFFAVLV